MNYRELKENEYYVVDKSMMISDFMERGSKVTLITRPHPPGAQGETFWDTARVRFSEMLNMNMMAEFFDITKDSKDIFKNTAIMNTEYAKEMRQGRTASISILRFLSRF